jgi:hypothetical protein
MKFFLLWLTSLAFYQSGKAQANTNQEKSIESHKVDSSLNNKSRIILKYVPSALLATQTPTVMVGIEYQPAFVRNVGVELSYGFKAFQYDAFTNAAAVSTDYYKVKSELKYYLPFNKYISLCVAFEFRNLRKNTLFENARYEKEDGGEFSFDQANEISQINCFSFKYGVAYRLGTKFTCETSVSLGARYIRVQFVNLVNPQEQFDYSKKEWGTSWADLLEKHKSTFYVGLELKVGYIISLP